MPPEIAPFFVLAVVAATFVVFALEIYPPEVVALGALAAVLGSGVLGVNEALAALANPAPVTIAAMFVLSAAMVRVGALDAVSAALVARARRAKALALGGMGALVLLASAFMNNTPIVVMMIPVAIRLAGALGVGASRLLIPLSYTAIFGGMCTLIGTSTNLLVDGVAREAGMRPFGIFEVTGVALAAAAAGLVYMLAIGRRLLPDRRALADSLGQRREQRFTTEVAIPEGSSLVGASPLEVAQFNREGVRVIDVLRGDASLRRELSSVTLRAGDRVVLRSRVRDIVDIRRERALVGSVDQLSQSDAALVEALVTPDCRLVGRQLGRLRLRRRYGVYPVGMHRRDHRSAETLEDVVIRAGDTLLLEGDPADIHRLAEDVNLVELSRPRVRPYRRDRAPLVIGALAGVVALSALGLAPIATLAVIAAALVLLLRCIDADEAFEAVDGRILTLILCMLGLGAALEKTGAVRLIVDAATPMLQGAPPQLALLALVLTTSLLTEAVTNNAVAVVMTPVAIGLAESLGVDARPFVVGVMIAASAAFATPIGYQTNTLVYAVGGYRFTDYVRVGAPLNLITAVLTTLMVPLFWSF